MDDILNALGQIAGTALATALLLAVLWWLWRGVVGTWLLIKYLTYKGFWQNTCLVIVLGLVFGWNVVLGLLIILICLGPITEAIAKGLWESELRSG
ncbi:MAG: hypothetical protein H8D43_01090 [Chloroflexi bacterium]|nr:hypothetical protein [Chloroflexota bacterium]